MAAPVLHMFILVCTQHSPTEQSGGKIIISSVRAGTAWARVKQRLRMRPLDLYSSTRQAGWWICLYNSQQINNYHGLSLLLNIQYAKRKQGKPKYIELSSN